MPAQPGRLSQQAQRTVLITGASTGLGLALAQRLIAASQYRLILTARKSSLERFGALGIEPQPRVMLLPLDVNDAEQRKAAVARVDRDMGGVDVLVNNAGLAYRSVVEHVEKRESSAQMAVNFSSPMEMTRLVLPGMRAKRRGHIVNISSVGGMMAMPTMAAYSASKFALEGATEALWYEVRPWRVRVTLVEPGFINSPSFWNTRYTDLSRHSTQHREDPYHNHYQHMGRFIERTMRFTRDTPQHVARRVHRLIQRRRPPLRAQVTFDAHVFSLLRRLLPRSIYHAALYRALPGVKHWGRNSF